MKEQENDKILSNLLKKIELEKPASNFTYNVMSAVQSIEAEKSRMEKLNILDTKFWIFVFLFVLLAATLIILSAKGLQTESIVNDILPSIDTGKVGNGYQTLLDKVNGVPISIAAILLASSILIFVERFLSSKKIFA